LQRFFFLAAFFFLRRFVVSGTCEHLAMLVLFETAAGFALFKVKDGKVKSEDLSALFATADAAKNTVSGDVVLGRWMSGTG
jgi:hypothetical protein